MSLKHFFVEHLIQQLTFDTAIALSKLVFFPRKMIGLVNQCQSIEDFNHHFTTVVRYSADRLITNPSADA